MLAINQIHLMDCFDAMKQIPDGTFRSIITDMPYFKTRFEWDSKTSGFDFGFFLDECMRVIGDDGVFVTTCDIRLLFQLYAARPHLFRYECIWEKDQPTGHMNAKWRPMINHEFIVVFSRANMTSNPNTKHGVYHPQGLTTHNRIENGLRTRQTATHSNVSLKADHLQLQKNFPKSVVRFPKEAAQIAYIMPPRHRFSKSIVRFQHEGDYLKRINPTQKPIEMYKWLIKTYSDPGDLIYEPFCGSGTTAIAAMLTGRNFIATELMPDQYKSAQQRLRQTVINYELVEAAVEREREYLDLPNKLVAQRLHQPSLLPDMEG